MGRLFHPELVTIQPMDRAGQVVDDLADEPYARIARGSAVQVLAQVEENDLNRRRPTQGGAVVTNSGVVTFRPRDLTRASYTPTAGDMITAVADKKGNNPRTVRWYLQDGGRYSGKRPRGRSPDLVVCRFSPRPPSREQVEGL